MRKILLIIILTSTTFIAGAQNVLLNKEKIQQVKLEDFSRTYPSDTSASAVYIFDAGSIYYETDLSGITFKRHVRIHLLNKKSFDDEATVRIPLYDEGTTQILENLDASTFNLENGQVVETRLDKKTIFKDVEGNFQIIKFTFPNIKAGSVIEYSYKILTYNIGYINTWYFQGRSPKLWSEFVVSVPDFYNFIISDQQSLPYEINTTTQAMKNFGLKASLQQVQATVVEHDWAMKNVPALKVEPYVTTMRNYEAKIEFQLSTVQYPYQQMETVVKNWTETNEELLKSDRFGLDLSHNNNWLDDDVKKAIGKESDALKKAKLLYEFIKNNYGRTNTAGAALSQPLRKTEQSGKGNVADINILLTAILKDANIEADPVLLSTRNNGKTESFYPNLSKFNYVVCHAVINGQSYLLDASNSHLGFGELDENCYNDYGYIISKIPHTISLSSDSLLETKLTYLFIRNESNNELSGNYTSNLGKIESINAREKLSHETKEEFFKEIKTTSSADATISNLELDSITTLDEPVSLKYDVSIKTGDDIIYFNPMFPVSLKNNPFASAERSYPVELPYCTDEAYILNMEVPAGYKIDELPKSEKVTLNDNEGFFEYIINEGGGQLQLRCRIFIKKANFQPEDYETLRNFFAFIVQKEGEQIVFKKI